MDYQRANEESPLLESGKYEAKGRKKPTPLPKLQIGILLVLQLAEPITSQCIAPFIHQLISELDVTGGDMSKVGYYAGAIQSLFFATEALTVFQWSRLSDHIGRKPVLLVGLFGLCISMLCFGLSITFWSLVISRCLAGALNGNIGVMKSMMGDLTDSSNIAQAFSWLPVVWSAGVTIGPFIGGSLSRPHDRFPGLFQNSFWAQYPYFLPCLASSLFSAFSFVVAAIFLKESFQTASDKRPPNSRSSSVSESDLYVPAMVIEVQPAELGGAASPLKKDKKQVPMRALLTGPVLLSISCYAVLALLDIALWCLLPLFLATPIELNGLGLSPPTIGYCLGAFGLMNGLLQGLFFAPAVDRWGPRQIFLNGLLSFVPIYALFPIISMVAKDNGLSPAVWLLLMLILLLCVIMDMAFGCVFIFITAAAPDKHSLGATNGLSQTTISIIRAITPACSTSLFAFSVERNIMGGYVVYLALIVFALLSLLIGMRLPTEVWEREDECRRDAQ